MAQSVSFYVSGKTFLVLLICSVSSILMGMNNNKINVNSNNMSFDLLQMRKDVEGLYH